MEKWICEVCGYAHYGDEAPAQCPQCGALKSQFNRERKGNGYAIGIIFVLILIIAFVYTIISS